jgi:L-serine dehydratase
MLTYKSLEEMVNLSAETGKKLWELIIEDQSQQCETPQDELYLKMEKNFRVMQESISEGLAIKGQSPSGLSAGWADMLKNSIDQGKSIGDNFFSEVLVKALAVAQCNSRMGRIVAAPTAGSCGIIPAVLVTAMEKWDIPEKDIIQSLFTAAGVGMVIANRASIAGADGGCQAECGSASAMAAAALVELRGGSPVQSMDAVAISLKNTLGLVCDPVAGLVEVPCIKRNAGGAANALVAAELAIAGIESIIPADEVIDTMKKVGNSMPEKLKETAKGGLADTLTARRLTKQIFEG